MSSFQAYHFSQAAGCGDGVIDAGESCDDGGTAGGDGCSATCQIECGTTIDATYDNDLVTPGTQVTLYQDYVCAGLGFSAGVNDLSLDCDDHTLTGNGTSVAVYLYGPDNITVKNCVIDNFSGGIGSNWSTNTTVQDNTLSQIGMTAISFARSSNSIVTGNTITNATYGIAYDTETANSGQITFNNISDSDYGIQMRPGSSNATISNNTIEDSSEYGIHLQTGGHTLTSNTVETSVSIKADIYNSGSSNTGDQNTCHRYYRWTDDNPHAGETDGCTFWPAGVSDLTVQCGEYIYKDTVLDQDYNCVGLGFAAGGSNLTLDCDNHTISGNSTSIGVSLTGPANFTVKNCTFDNFSGGVASNRSNSVTVQDNTFTQIVNSSISFARSVSNTITGNTITGSTTGIAFDIETSNSGTVSNNTITGADYGIHMRPGSSNSTISNNIIENSVVHGIYLQTNDHTLTSNVSVNSGNKDIVNSGTGNTGDNNSCDPLKLSNWQDDGEASQCTYPGADIDSDGVYNNTDACDNTSPGVPSSLVTYWGLDEGAALTAQDSYGGNTGTLTNGPVWGTGQLDSALDFDGVDDYIDFGDILDSTISGPDQKFTLSAWIKPGSASMANDFILSKYSLSGNPGGAKYRQMIFRLIDNKLAFFWQDENASPLFENYQASTVIDNLSKWYHVVATYDGTKTLGSRVSLYVDGSFDAVSALNTQGTPSYIQDTDAGVEIGSGDQGGLWADYSFDGLIDEVAVFSGVLSLPEISGLYTNGLADKGYCQALPTVTDSDSDGVVDADDVCDNSSPDSPNGLVSYWGFEEAGGTDTADSHNGYPATLFGNPTWTTGQIGGAIDFDGVDDYVDLGDIPAFDFSNEDFTIVSWVNLSELPTWAPAGCTPLSPVFSNHGEGYTLNINETGNVVFSKYTSGAGEGVVSTSAISTGDWHHLAAVHTPTEMRVYVDGQLSNTSSTALGDIYYTLDDIPKIGIRSCGSGYLRFKGQIDDVAVYSRALNLTEIKIINNNGLANSGTCVSTITHEPEPSLDITATAGSTATIDGGTGDITIKEVDDTPLVTFPSGTTGTSTVTASTTTAGGGLTYVQGATLPGGETKTVYVDKNL
ncbi:LamG-like jellyroll fold domain-containing protein, partial [Patescibacteria group bacterium]